MLKKSILISILACLFLSSCNFGSKEPTFSHFSFRESKRDKFGLIDTQGKILIEDEFEEEPSPVMNGIFFAKDSHDLFEMYSIDNPTKPIGDSYVNILCFREDVTPCVMKNEGIKYIDKQGKVKFELPLDYVTASRFINGYSIISKRDNEEEVIRDAISKDGDIVKFKKYSILSVLGKDDFLVYDKEERDENKAYIVNKEGEIKLTFKNFLLGESPATYINMVFSRDHKLYVYYNEDVDGYGIKSIDGDIIVNAKEDQITYFDNLNDKIITKQFDEEYYHYLCGVMDLQGNVLIKARYSNIMPLEDNIFVVRKDNKYGLINLDEERLIPFEYAYMNPSPDNKTVFAKQKDDEDARWEWLDTKGKELGDYVEIGTGAWNFDYDVESNYLDVADMFNTIFKPSDSESINDLYSFQYLPPETCANNMGESYSHYDVDFSNTWLPDHYMKYTHYGSLYISLGFFEVFASEVDYWGDYYYYYTNDPCDRCKVKLSLNYNYQERVDYIKKELPAAMKECGFVKDDYYYDDFHYKNSYVKIEVEIDDYSIVVTAEPI